MVPYQRAGWGWACSAAWRFALRWAGGRQVRDDTGSCHSAPQGFRWRASPPALHVPLLLGTPPDGKAARAKMPSGAAWGMALGGARMESCAGLAACLRARQCGEAQPPRGMWLPPSSCWKGN